MTAHRLITATLAGVAAVALAVAVPVAAAASSHPAASASTASTRYLPANGGTVKWTVRVHDAKSAWCMWTSSPTVSGFNAIMKCKTSTISRSARFKANRLRRPTTYKITLTVLAEARTVDRWRVIEAGKAAPTSTTTTTTTTAPTSASCTNPSYSTSEAEGTDNTDPNDGAQYWWVNNDAWSGSHGPQTLYVCNKSSWYAVSNQPNDGGQVETYPDTEYDVGGRENPSTTPINGFSAITSTYADVEPAAGGWDAAYDLWTNDWTNETMIWTSWAGSNAFWADCASAADPETYCGVQQNAAVTLDGVGYHFLANGPSGTNCTTSNEADCELMFFADTQASSGSVDLLAAFQWEVANGYAKASDVPTQLCYGVEISYTSGAETFATTGLTFSLAR